MRIEKKKQAVKMRYHDDNQNKNNHDKNQKYLKNAAPKVTYQKAKYQGNPEVQLAFSWQLLGKSRK